MATKRKGAGLDELEPSSLYGRLVADKIEIRELLGEGAMGFVFRAIHRALGKPVAIKVLKPHVGWDPLWRERFAREAKSAARFDHPNSVQILDFGEDGLDRLTYIVMEYIEGRSLIEELMIEGPMKPDRLARIMLQVLAALAAAHDRGVIHRDIKSANIMVSSRKNDDGEAVEIVKVCDFGIAKMLSAQNSEHSPITYTGAFVGTPAYISPEQAAADPIDERTDIYSCGVVMYEMLSGQLPYVAENYMAMIAKHLADEPTHLSDIVPNIPRRLETIVHWALEKRKELRCPSARELRRALKEYLALERGDSLPRAGVPPLTTQADPLPPFSSDTEATKPLPVVISPAKAPVVRSSSSVDTDEGSRK